jgi:hypothetical protein
MNRHAAVRLLLDELVGAVVPDLDRARAVVPLRDLALEGRIGERVVLDVHREHLRPRLERDALRDGPAEENAAALEAEVVVEPARVVALDDEDRRLAAPTLRERLRGRAPRALALVVLQRHMQVLPAHDVSRDRERTSTGGAAIHARTAFSTKRGVS